MPDYGPSNVEDLSDIRHVQMQDARHAVAHITAEALSDLAEVLRERARTEKNKILFGLSVLASMAAQTGLGALELYHKEMWYAGIAISTLSSSRRSSLSRWCRSRGLSMV